MARRELSADILVVGGGMIGQSLALALARAGLSVVGVDRLPPAAATTPAFDGRVTSVAYGSHAMLDRLGVWRALSRHAEPILDIRVSDGDAPFYLHFDHRDVGDRPFGFMVENRHIRTALQRAVAAEPDLTMLAPAAVVDLACGGRAVATLDDGRTVSAPLAVAADGRDSPLRRRFGIRSIGWRYGQTAIVCTARHALPHHGVAKEHFLPAGPFALLPMRGMRSSVVWTERDAAAPAMLDLDDDAFSAELQARAGDHLGAVRVDGPRWRFPLALHNAERYVAPRLALVGDAAHAMHPIAGQGLNLGLRDAACLAELVVEQARLGLDIGAGDLLRRYEQWRRWDALTMLMMTDGLNRLFSTELAPVRLVRGLGLGLVNGLPPLKRLFERHAAAMTGDLPRLIRGEAL